MGLNNILSYKRQNEEQFINNDIKMFQMELTVEAGDATGTKLEMAINEWNLQEFYNLYCNIEKQWFIYNALNHEMFFLLLVQ